MKKVLGTFLLIVLVAVTFAPSALATSSDPTQSLNRLRIVINTTSDWSRLTLPAGDSIVNNKKTLVSGSGAVTVGNTSVLISGNSVGSPAIAQYEILMTTDGLLSGLWQLTKGSSYSTSHVDIYNINDVNNPVLISSQDQNADTAQAKTFTISGEAESMGGPLTTASGSMGQKKVFANYVPWWSYSSWDSPNKIDRPTTLYSVRVRADVERIVGSAASSGIDGFITSYQGDDRDGAPWRILMDVANQRTDVTFAAYMETSIANAGHTASQPTDPAYMRQWITEIVQNYGSSPSYLKMNVKPVIFIYRARVLTPDVWKSQVFDPLRAQGIDAFYVADYVAWDGTAPVPEYLAVFDGMHSFNPSVYATLSDTSIATCLTSNSQATKTYSLLNDTAAPRKLWMGTVVPGFDGRLIYGQDSIYIPRDNGNFYRSIWETNMSTNPDWVMVTTWNDYGENTHIEGSVTYGNTYLDMTKSYADSFRSTNTSEGALSINNLQSTAILPAGFEVTWQTSGAADSELVYGAASGDYNGHVSIGTTSDEHWLVATGLQPGRYYGRVKSTAADGLTVISPEFEMIIPNEEAPALSIAPERVYWANYAEYQNRSLSVDFRIVNSGVEEVLGLSVINVEGSAGVTNRTGLPLSVGSIPAGADTVATVEWRVPSGVGSFSARLWAMATTLRGTRVYYPEAPPINS